MREMKDSDIEWIGNIPRDWDLKPIKYSFYISSGATPQSTIPEYWDGDLRWITPADFKTLDKFISEGKRRITSKGFLSCGTKMVNPGTIILSKRAPIGSVVIASEKLCTNQGCLCCIPLNHAISTVYFYYLMSIYDDIFNLYGSGTTFKEISADTFGRLTFPVPSYNEQVLISKYLDNKCTEIDSIKADIQKEIETLQEYRKSVITEAVTKGLDPYAEMKDSGVDWIGMIPKHWDITKLKYSNKAKTDKLGLVKEDLNYIALENISNWTAKYIQTENSYEITDSIICKKGDVIFGKLRPYLAKGLIIEHECCCSSEFAVFSKPECPQFLLYYLLTPSVITFIDNSTYGTKMPRANIHDIVNIPYPRTSISEQFKISAYLNSKCAEIDSIIEDKQKQLETLAEYRKSLIYEYVTGKKEVPIC